MQYTLKDKEEREKEERLSPCTPSLKKKKRKEERGRRRSSAREEKIPVYVNPPSLDEIAGYIRKMKLTTFDAEEFFDVMSEKGWMFSGTIPLYDWKSAARRWEKYRLGQKGSMGAGARPYARTTPEARQQRLLNAETQRMDDIERQIRERDARLAEQKAQSVSLEEYKRMKAEGRI